MNRKNITGMIAVFDNAVLNARLDYAIDLKTNKVMYYITCNWKLRNVCGKCPFRNYKDAKVYFSGLPNAAELEAKANAA